MSVKPNNKENLTTQPPKDLEKFTLKTGNDLNEIRTKQSQLEHGQEDMKKRIKYCNQTVHDLSESLVN